MAFFSRLLKTAPRAINMAKKGGFGTFHYFSSKEVSDSEEATIKEQPTHQHHHYHEPTREYRRLGSSVWDNLTLSIDWREAMGPVKDQQDTDYCYIFAALDAIEGTYYISTGQRISLSAAYLIDRRVGWDEDAGGGCMLHLLEYLRDHGCPREEDYGWHSHPDLLKIKDFEFIFLPLLMEVALVKGPLIVSLHHRESFFDHDGMSVIYDDEDDMEYVENRHSSTIVGKGRIGGIDVWAIRGVWSHRWAARGHALIYKEQGPRPRGVYDINLGVYKVTV